MPIFVGPGSSVLTSAGRSTRCRPDGARFRGVYLGGVVMRGVELVDVDIREIQNVTVNGVDIGPLVEAELDRRYPDRAKMRPAAGRVPRAWDVLERLWDGTVERARRLGPSCCMRRSTASGRSSRRFGTWCSPPTPGSGGRSSVIRRHGTPWTCRGTSCLTCRGCPRPCGTPSLDAVLRLRRDRMATVRRVIEGLTDESLNGDTEPVEAPGWPESQLPGSGVPVDPPQRGVGAPAVRRARPGCPRGTFAQ